MGAARRIWNAPDHPRGPNGRFVKGGGGSGPSPRTPAAAPPASASAAVHGARPGSAAALFAAGAGKGRIHASTSRPISFRPSGASPNREHQPRASAEADIRSAVLKLRGRPGDWVGLADLRDALGTRHSRGEIDAALNKLIDEPGVRIIPVANTKALKPRDREAAVSIGGEDSHAITFTSEYRPPAASAPQASKRVQKLTDEQLANGITMRGTDSPAGRDLVAEQQRRAAAVPSSGAAKKPTGARQLDPGRVGAIGAQLASAKSRTEARSALSGLTSAQLRQVAASLGATVGSKYTKTQLVDRLVEITGRRLDSAAIQSMSARKAFGR